MCCDTEPRVAITFKKAVESAAELGMTVEVNSDQSERQGAHCKLDFGCIGLMKKMD